MNPLWIDTAMGFDDLAAVLAVAGLSLVAGNAPLPVVIDNVLRSAACFGWRFPIHAARPGRWWASWRPRSTCRATTRCVRRAAACRWNARHSRRTMPWARWPAGCAHHPRP